MRVKFSPYFCNIMVTGAKYPQETFLSGTVPQQEYGAATTTSVSEFSCYSFSILYSHQAFRKHNECFCISDSHFYSFKMWLFWIPASFPRTSHYLAWRWQSNFETVVSKLLCPISSKFKLISRDKKIIFKAKMTCRFLCCIVALSVNQYS